MKASFVAAAAFAAGSQALSYGYGSNVTVSVPDVYTTKVVTALTTVCPTPTQITVGGKTYTVSTSTTLTITNCPCTISYKASSAPPASAPATSVPKPPVTTAVYTPGAPSSSPAPGKPSSPGSPASSPVVPYYPSSNGTVVYSVKPTGTSAPTTTAPPKFTGAATKVGAGAMAIVAAAAAFL